MVGVLVVCPGTGVTGFCVVTGLDVGDVAGFSVVTGFTVGVTVVCVGVIVCFVVIGFWVAAVVAVGVGGIIVVIGLDTVAGFKEGVIFGFGDGVTSGFIDGDM